MVPMHALKKERRLPRNLPRVAAEVTRRTLFDHRSYRLLTSAATVQGFNARIGSGNSLPVEGRGRMTPSVSWLFGLQNYLRCSRPPTKPSLSDLAMPD